MFLLKFFHMRFFPFDHRNQKSDLLVEFDKKKRYKPRDAMGAKGARSTIQSVLVIPLYSFPVSTQPNFPPLCFAIFLMEYVTNNHFVNLLTGEHIHLLYFFCNSL